MTEEASRPVCQHPYGGLTMTDVLRVDDMCSLTRPTGDEEFSELLIKQHKAYDDMWKRIKRCHLCECSHQHT